MKFIFSSFIIMMICISSKSYSVELDTLVSVENDIESDSLVIPVATADTTVTDTLMQTDSVETDSLANINDTTQTDQLAKVDKKIEQLEPGKIAFAGVGFENTDEKFNNDFTTILKFLVSRYADSQRYLGDLSIPDTLETDCLTPDCFREYAIENNIEVVVYGNLNYVMGIYIFSLTKYDVLKEEVIKTSAESFRGEETEILDFINVVAGELFDVQVGVVRKGAKEDTTDVIDTLAVDTLVTDTFVEVDSLEVDSIAVDDSDIDSLELALDEKKSDTVVVNIDTKEIEAVLKALSDSISAALNQKTQATVVLSVLPFLENGKITNESSAVSEMALRYLQPKQNINVVDKANFQKAIQEIALTQTGITDDDNLLEAGRVMAAQYLVSGSVNIIGNNTTVIVRLTETETTKVVKIASMTIQTKDVANLSKDLFREQASVSSYVFRSFVLPGWGQFYAGKTIRGTIALAGTAAVGGYAILSWKKVLDAKETKDVFENDTLGSRTILDEYVNNRGEEGRAYIENRYDELYDDYDKKFDKAWQSSFILMGVWLGYNLVDAAIAGVQESRKFRVYFDSDLFSSFNHHKSLNTYAIGFSATF